VSPRTARVRDLLEEVRAEYAPDPRLAVFEVEAELDGDSLVLQGATSEPAAAEALHRGAAALGGWAAVRDEVARLPYADGAEPVHAPLRVPGERADRVHEVVPVAHEQRQHEVLGAERRLGEHAARGGVPAQAPEEVASASKPRPASTRAERSGAMRACEPLTVPPSASLWPLSHLLVDWTA